MGTTQIKTHKLNADVLETYAEMESLFQKHLTAKINAHLLAMETTSGDFANSYITALAVNQNIARHKGIIEEYLKAEANLDRISNAIGYTSETNKGE